MLRTESIEVLLSMKLLLAKASLGLTSHATAVASIVRYGIHTNGRRAMTRVEVIGRRATKVLMARRQVTAIITVRSEHLRGWLVCVHTAISLHLRILLLTIASIMSTVVDDHAFPLMVAHHSTSEVVV